MEYHYGVCIKELKYIQGHYNSIVVLAGDNNNENFWSFYVKVFDRDEGIEDSIKNIKFGNAVFFTAHNETIIEIYDVDKVFSKGGRITCGDYETSNYLSSKLELRHKNQHNMWIPSQIHGAEISLMQALSKRRQYDSYLNSVPKITLEYLEEIIQEEKSVAESYDIDDMITQLKISYYASDFYTRTDEPEAYNLYERRGFENTIYENCKLDAYLNDVFKLGDTLIKENEGWFYAKERAKDDILENTRKIPYLKEKMRNKSSKSEHLNYRVRKRLLDIVSPLHSLVSIQGDILDLKTDWHQQGLKGYWFIDIDDKERILSNVKEKNSSLKHTYKQEFKTKIFSSLSRNEIEEKWCIPSPINMWRGSY